MSHILLITTVVAMFFLGKWWSSCGTQREVIVPQVLVSLGATRAEPTDYESALAKLPAADFPVQWKALDRIALADRDLTWPIKCGALWERWAAVDLQHALLALPPAPEVVVVPEFPHVFQIPFPRPPSNAAEPGWVPDLPRHAVYAAWAMMDADAALAKAKTLPTAERVAAVRGVMETFASTKPLRFLREATTTGPIYSNFDRLKAFANLAQSSAAEAAAFIKQVPVGAYAQWDPRHGGLWGDDAWKIVLKAWAQQDIQAAASYMETLTGNDFPLRAMIFKELVDADPAHAAGWLPKLAQDSRHHFSMISFAQMLKLVPFVQEKNLLSNLLGLAIERFPRCSAEEFPEAKRLFDALPASEQANEAHWTALLALWRKADPNGAMEAILARPDARLQSNLLADFVYPAYHGEPGAVAEILQRLAQVPEALRASVVATVSDKMTSHGKFPPASIRAVIDLIPPGKVHQSVLTDYYVRSARNQGNERPLATLLLAEPETSALHGAYFEVAQKWADKQSLEASQWVKALPGGATREQAIGGLIVSISRADPLAGLAWLPEMKDDATIVRTIREATDHMKPEQKRTFLQQINHPEAQRILREIPSPP